jgi:serine/threonine-protein kinase
MACAGTVLGGRYELHEQIGHGGFSEVWRAADTVLSRQVGVKLLHPGYALHPEALARFRAEARHAAALSHQNIARVYDYGEPADGLPPYLVMELVDGPSLADVLTGGPLDTRRSMDVIAQAAAGLQAAHAEGLIHRDIKPANLLLARGGTVKITDFGIAHAVGSVPVTVTGELMGTPGYLAPERMAGEQATSASDLYALGVVAYECLAGAPPFAGMPLEVALAQRDRPLPPLPLSVPAEVCAFVMYLTAKDPARRPGSAAEVALRAGRLRDGAGTGTGGGPHPSPGAPAEPSPTVRFDLPPGAVRLRRRLILALASVVLAGLTGLALASMTGFMSGPHPASVPSSTSSKPSAQSPGRGNPASSGPTVTPDMSGDNRGNGNANGNGDGNGNGD